MSDTTSVPHPEHDTSLPDPQSDPQPDPHTDHPADQHEAEPSGPGEALRRDGGTMFGGNASLEDRIAAGEDAIRQVLGFLRWMFPSHPVPTFAHDPDSGLLKPGPVDPAIAASASPDPDRGKDDPKPS
jgi:hypothetical protein